MASDLGAQVAGVAALNDPVRRSLYLFVVNSSEPISREQAAQAVGIQKTLAAFHLEKLVEENLLDFEFRRLTGRAGPGAGRPAKLYRRSERQIELSLPPRQYDLAGLLLAGAIDAADRSGRSVRDELERAALTCGRMLGDDAIRRAGSGAPQSAQREALCDVLRDHGFEPRVEGEDIALSNCPFHALAQEYTGLVCAMNLHLLEGVRSALDLPDPHLRPRLQPAPGRCCVKFCTGGR